MFAIPPSGEKLMAPTVSLLCRVFSWQTLTHGHCVGSTPNFGLVGALAFHTQASVLLRNSPCKAEQVPLPLLKDKELDGQHKFYFLCRSWR